jgi:hypothetical protein
VAATGDGHRPDSAAGYGAVAEDGAAPATMTDLYSIIDGELGPASGCT